MPKEGQFYVEYLGWKETRGLYGSEYTDPIVAKLVSRQKKARQLHRMTIRVTRDELQISQHVTGSNGKSQKIRYPPQQMCDVSYLSEGRQPHTNVVGCIFLGYNTKTRCAAHVHAYIFDSADTATVFVKLVNSIIAQSEYRQRIQAMERDLFQLGHINVRTSQHDTMGSDGASHGSHSPGSSDNGISQRQYPSAGEALKDRKDIVIKRTPSLKKEEKSKLFATVQDELEHKLTLQQEKETPILLPPKDYDTIVRRYGHLSIRAKVKQRSVVGADSIFNGHEEGNNNGSAATTGYKLQKSQSSGSGSDPDNADTVSSFSSTDDDPSVYGLYRGLKPEESSSVQDMAMWSPDFSFGHQTTSSDSSGLNSSGAGLRRMKVPK